MDEVQAKIEAIKVKVDLGKLMSADVAPDFYLLYSEYRRLKSAYESLPIAGLEEEPPRPSEETSLLEPRKERKSVRSK